MHALWPDWKGCFMGSINIALLGIVTLAIIVRGVWPVLLSFSDAFVFLLCAIGRFLAAVVVVVVDDGVVVVVDGVVVVVDGVVVVVDGVDVVVDGVVVVVDGVVVT